MRAELCPPRWMASGWPLAETRLCRVEHFNRPRGSQRFVCKPLGTGAGYAGGIVSAAVDGIRVAEAIAKG